MKDDEPCTSRGVSTVLEGVTYAQTADERKYGVAFPTL